jgi:hypothetical protein
MPTQFVPTTTTICNMCLGHLAVGKTITAITDANDQNAKACAVFFDTTRDEVLREFNWPFARRYATLVLVGGTTTVPVTMDYQYSYRLPADCLRPRRLLPGTRLDVPQTRWSFIVGSDSTGRLLYTDFPVIVATADTPQQPQLEYTTDITAEAQFTSEFAQALAAKLAFYLAPAISQGGDSGKLGARAYQLYQQIINQAQATALNEEVPDPAPESQFVLTRDG